ncbi:MAG: hypothetical protein HUU21_31200 [Polyangiaceae bacterium]|nr:hypothetical protein [Polyangiaceae bacterium]
MPADPIPFPTADQAPPGFKKIDDLSKQQVLSQILQEHDVSQQQRKLRAESLKKIEDFESTPSATIGFLSSANAAIDADDIPALGDVLMSVGDVDVLNLIISSPGGDGLVAEKIIEICRAYCKTFRVIIPNRAKSAATIIALGADEIVMGYCSEIGPIDAQVPIVVGGIPRYISAQSFINARTKLEAEYQQRVKNNIDAKDLLTQLATLDVPFIDHCEKLMDFSRDVAESNLRKHMFAGVKPKKAQDQLVNNVLKQLSATELFKVHGRMIDANSAKTILKLKTRILPKDDELWKAIWAYYVRAEVLFARNLFGKLIESKHESLVQQNVMLSV